MSEDRIIIEFTCEEFDLIMQYMEFVEATTVQNAVMNAISLAMDHPANEENEMHPCEKFQEWQCDGCQYADD